MQAWLETYMTIQIGWRGTFPRWNITDFPWYNGAKLCNMADFSELPVKNELVQFVLKDFFTTKYYRRRRIVLCWICSGLIKKTREKGFRRACLSGKFVSLHLLIFNEIEDYRIILCIIIFCANEHFWLFCIFCIVWYVIATSSWIFTPNVEKCDFK